MRYYVRIEACVEAREGWLNIGGRRAEFAAVGEALAAAWLICRNVADGRPGLHTVRTHDAYECRFDELPDVCAFRAFVTDFRGERVC